MFKIPINGKNDMKKVLLATLFALSISNAAYADDIIDSAIADGSLKTFVTAVKAAGLEETLKSAGPFTVLHQTMMHLQRFQKTN